MTVANPVPAESLPRPGPADKRLGSPCREGQFRYGCYMGGAPPPARPRGPAVAARTDRGLVQQPFYSLGAKGN